MPAHYNVQRLKLEDEIARLRKAGKRILAVVPEVLQISPHKSYHTVDTYIVLFEDES